LKKEVGLFGGDGEVPQLIHDEQIQAGRVQESLAQAVVFLGRQEVLAGGEQDSIFGQASLDAEGDGQVGFAHARRPEEEEIFLVLQEIQRGEADNLLFGERKSSMVFKVGKRSLTILALIRRSNLATASRSTNRARKSS